MSENAHDDSTPVANPSNRASRRRFLRSSAGLLGSAAAAGLPSGALAQSAADQDVTRLMGARRILIKGAVVLTLDHALGDFAKADILIEDGRIRAVRLDIAASDAAVIDGANRIAIPGFVDTHSHS